VHVSTNRMVRLAAGVGTRFPAYATSLGRAILAFETPPAREAYLDAVEFTEFTAHTITTREGLAAVLAQVRADRFAATKDELDYGLISIATPILDAGGRAVAAINCSTSTSRVTMDELVESRLPALRNAGRHIESALRRQMFLLRSIHPD